MARLAAREAAFVGAHAPIERPERFGDDNVVLMTVEDGRNRGGLGFRHRGYFLNHHSLGFTLSTRAAGGQPNHPQRHHALSIDAKLRGFERYFEPWIDQKDTVCRTGEQRRRRTLVRGMI